MSLKFGRNSYTIARSSRNLYIGYISTPDSIGSMYKKIFYKVGITFSREIVVFLGGDTSLSPIFFISLRILFRFTL